jgi:hypothetical protein
LTASSHHLAFASSPVVTHPSTQDAHLIIIIFGSTFLITTSLATPLPRLSLLSLVASIVRTLGWSINTILRSVLPCTVKVSLTPCSTSPSKLLSTVGPPLLKWNITASTPDSMRYAVGLKGISVTYVWVRFLGLLSFSPSELQSRYGRSFSRSVRVLGASAIETTPPSLLLPDH